MLKAVETMKAKVSSGGKGIVSRNRIREALALVDSRGADEACESHLRYLCWALWEPTARKVTLMGRNDGTVRQVLEVAQHDLRRKALSLSAWRGLVAGYLDPEERPASEPEASNWLEIRDFLSQTLPKVITSSRFVPDWLRELADNRELLTAKPCDRYAAATASGDTTAVDRLRDNLSIPAESWFWKELILSQVRHLCTLDNTGYLTGLDAVLKLLEGRPALADDALATILPRHYASLAEHAHPGLQDFAVKSWGSPNIFSQAKWSLVEEPIKGMVREWLVKEDLRDFFSLLQADQAADQRRLTFWLEYAKQIDFAHFVLGATVWHSPQADYKEMRARKRSRIAQLVDGSPTNNAFVLKVGDYFFVEFGETGNACYIYRADDVPFDVRRHQHSLHDLKNKRRAVEHPSHMGSWEWKFKQILQNFGIFPDRDRRSTQRPSVPPPSRPTPAPSPPTAPATSSATPVSSGIRVNDMRASQSLGLSQPAQAATPASGDWAARAREIARTHKMELVDQRSKGGCLWVMARWSKHPAADELVRLGFKFADGRGYWRKK